MAGRFLHCLRDGVDPPRLLSSLLAVFDKSCSTRKPSSLSPTITTIAPTIAKVRTNFQDRGGDLLKLDLGSRLLAISPAGLARETCTEQTGKRLEKYQS
jgi:hypothetical protein